MNGEPRSTVHALNKELHALRCNAGGALPINVRNE